MTRSAAISPDRPPRRVFVRDLEIVASVGVFEVEHRYEQRIVIDLDLAVTDDYDGLSERLADVLDYAHLVSEVEKVVQSRHFKLIETLAERIAEVCLADSRVASARISVAKPDILPSCRSVGIEIERRRV